jgi:hypothetical protein
MSRVHSCKKVAQLLSQRLDEPLGLRNWIQLHIHLALCGNCRNVQVHLREMRDLSRNLFADDEEPGDNRAKRRSDDEGLRQG